MWCYVTLPTPSLALRGARGLTRIVTDTAQADRTSALRASVANAARIAEQLVRREACSFPPSFPRVLLKSRPRCNCTVLLRDAWSWCGTPLNCSLSLQREVQADRDAEAVRHS